MPRPVTESTCVEKATLLQEYESATHAYSEAMNHLQAKLGTSSKSEYKRLFQASEDARAKSEAARVRLLDHTRDHKC